MEPKSILMYNLNSEKGRKIKMLCLKNRIRIREVRPEQYLEPIGYLAGMKEVSSDGFPERDGKKQSGTDCIEGGNHVRQCRLDFYTIT